MGVYGQTDSTPPIMRVQQVPQSIETAVTFVEAPGAYVRYAYSRSSDSMASQIDGQDYLCFKYNDQRFVAVVCDGVGSSFCGNLAARILGDSLLEWLWSLDILYVNGPAALQEAAISYLNRLQRQAQREVEEYEIPAEIGGLVRQALEAQRAYGSEAIFAAVRIDHPGFTIPEGLISVLWMGDTTITVLDHAGQPLDMGGEHSNTDRWSSARGVRGRLFTWMHDLSEVARVVSYTDGLLAHADKLLDYSDARLDREIRAGSRLPSSDDVAFIDVVLRSPHYEGYADPSLPDPGQERPHLEPIWNPTGEGIYEVRWTWPGKGKVSFLIQEATSPALTDARVIEPEGDATSWKPSTPREPGHYYYRVRAIPRWGRMTPWSELRQTRVAYPPPATPTLEVVEAGPAVELRWSEGDEQLDYRLEAAPTAGFEQARVVYEGRATAWTLPPGSFRPGTYYFRVRAISDGGESAWSSAQQVTIRKPPPPRPHLGTLSYDAAHGGYVFRWQGSAGATYYEMRRRTDGGEEQITRLEDTVFPVGELEPGEYSFAVRACHDFGCSEWSDEQSFVITPPPPAEAPTLTLEGPDETGLVRLRWGEVAGATGYTIESAEESDFARARIQQVSETHHEITRREPGVLHFRVCATNSGGEGPWSNVERLAVAPPAPEWIEVQSEPDSDQVTLTWSAVGGRAIYHVERIIGEESVEVYSGEDTECRAALPAGAAGSVVTFRVRAELPGINSAWTESSPLTMQPHLPAPVMQQPVRNEAGTVLLEWEPVEESDYYRVEVAQDAAFEKKLHTTTIKQNSLSFHPPGASTYYFRVMACKRGDPLVVSAPSGTVSITVEGLSAPRLWPLDVQKAGKPFEIIWRGVPGCEYYELQESPSAEFAPQATRTLKVFHPTQKYARQGRTAGRYYYRVRAVDSRGKSSPWSKLIAVDVEEAAEHR
ncbi:MAG: hypothetical protein Kow00124_14720 [Anaerolineae bacterium]